MRSVISATLALCLAGATFASPLIAAERELTGTFHGTWKNSKSGDSGAISISFVSEARTHHFVADGTQKYEWPAKYTLDGGVVVITARRPPRVETLKVVRDAGGKIVRLSGSYTYEGKPWGTIDVSQ